MRVIHCVNPLWTDILTHWGRDKMTAILDDIFKRIFLNENVWISIKISLMFVPFDNRSTFVQVIAWHQISDKPLPEPMMTQFNDTWSQCVNKNRVHVSWTVYNALYLKFVEIKPFLQIAMQVPSTRRYIFPIVEQTVELPVIWNAMALTW